jgi:ABC-2 type transport system ATP-binding protein
MIEVEHVSKNYGSLRAVNDVSFRLEKGEVLGLLGPNAAGKTTLMRIMTGYLPPTEGRVTLDGKDISDNPVAAKRRIGYLPENPPLYNDMTVRSYLQFAAEIKGVPRNKRKERIDEVIGMVNLESVACRLIENVSKGYRQRVGLAQALMHSPEVLIFDEPTVGLDPKQIIDIRNLIKDLATEHTVLLSSHILPEVSATCDRVVILNEGRIVAIDTQEELSRRLQGSQSIRIEVAGAAADEVRKAVSGIANVVKISPIEPAGKTARLIVECRPKSDVRADIFNLSVSKKWTLLEMTAESLSLEDVFLKLTREEVAPGV